MKVEMVERVSTKSCGCNFHGGDSGPATRRLRPVVLALAYHRVGRFRHPPGIGPETLCLWPETPGRRAEAGDSGPQGPVTRVNSTNVLDEGLRIGEIGRRMNSKVRLVEIGVYRK
jgi:hypothetical protein